MLDLFAGLRGWSDPFRVRGHEIFSVDWDERFEVDLHADVNRLTPADLPWRPDVILASPPCERFSVMTIGRNWTKAHEPKTVGAAEALMLVEATVRLIRELEPRFFVIENPRAKLRKLDVMAPFERRTVTYCQYGEKFMKPTDLWSDRWPPSLRLRTPCRNGDACHTPASRGSTTGIQGTKRTKFRGGMIEDMSRLMSWDPRRVELSALRAKIPEQLSVEIAEAMERDFETPTQLTPGLVQERFW